MKISIEEYLKKKNAEEKLLLEVSNMDSKIKLILTQIAAVYKPSLMVIKEILLYSAQISKRDNVPQDQVLANADITDIKEPSQRLKVLRKNLFLKRFPERAKIEGALKKEVETIRKDMDVKVNLPEDLEGDTLEVNVKFKKVEELEKQLEDLKKVAKSKNLTNIQKLLTGKE